MDENYNLNNNVGEVENQQLNNFSQEKNEIPVQPQTVAENTFNDYSTPTDSSVVESPKPKGFNIKLLIIPVILVAVVGLVFFFIKSPKGKTVDEKENSNIEIKPENIKLVTKSTDTITTQSENNDNFLIHEGGYQYDKIITTKNEVLVPTVEGRVRYLGDGYYYAELDNSQIEVYSGGKAIYKFKLDSYKSWFYKDNIVYYTGERSKVTAYDLKQSKELWKIEGKNLQIYETGVMFLKDSDTTDAKYKIVDKSGKTILSSTEESIVMPNENYYYLINPKVKVEVYDYDNNKISELSLRDEEKYSYEFYNIISCDMYVVLKKGPNWDDKEYIIYDKDSKVVKSYNEKFSGLSWINNIGNRTILETYSNQDYSVLAFSSGTDAIVFKDGTIEEVHRAYTAEGDVHNNMGLDQTYTKKLFIYSSVEEGFLNTVGYKFVNLETKKSKTIDATSKIKVGEEFNGNYFTFNYTFDDYKKRSSIVYDKNLNVIYETEPVDNTKESSILVYPVNNKYLLEVEGEEEQTISLVNIETKEKTKLDVVGKYSSNNSKGLVTLLNEEYYLYSFS